MSRSPCSTANDHPQADISLLNEILAGLSSEKKTLPSKLLYDATGSELFQRITALPEYYLTRTEKKLLGAVRSRHGLLSALGTRSRTRTGGIRGQ